MATVNRRAKSDKVHTHEGGVAYQHISPYMELRRAVLSCLLWENEFYESGEDIVKRIEKLSAQVPPVMLASLAVEARLGFNLRHVSLLLAVLLVKYGQGRDDLLVRTTVSQVIKRADEIAEMLAIYWRKGKIPLPAQLKKGLADAFAKFDEYQFAKYDRGNKIKLRDVMRMVHPNPGNERRSQLYKRINERSLETPDTWEVGLSSGGNKKEVWTRLLSENKLGYLALLRNLRNMEKAGVDHELIKRAILNRKGGAERVLPFRYVAAARAAPQFEACIDQSLSKSIEDLPVLGGTTIILVDVSGSMDGKLSAKSDLTRVDAAAALASIINADSARVFTFSNNIVEIPHRKGMAGVDAIIRSQAHGGTLLGKALDRVYSLPYDRLIVITDEQTADTTPDPSVFGKKHYMINVASYQRGVGYGKYWTHIDGFSENVIRYIHEAEYQEKMAAD